MTFGPKVTRGPGNGDCTIALRLGYRRLVMHWEVDQGDGFVPH